jgi:hypothetical protein
MRRNIDILNEAHIRQIKLWLSFYGESQDDLCPWEHPCRASIFLCEAIFPRMGKAIIYDPCPCDSFGAAYVKRVARKVVKDWEERRMHNGIS